MMKHAKGYFGRRKNVWTVAKNAVEKAWQYSYRDRKNNKRNFRRLWITRINAAAAVHNMKYNVFISKLKKANINLNRKMLSQLAILDPTAFSKIVQTVSD